MSRRNCQLCRNKTCCCEPAPSPQPEDVAALEAYLAGLPVAAVRAALLGYGLHIVGPAERAVLDAAATGDPGELTWLDSWCERVWEAELARRGSQ